MSLHQVGMGVYGEGVWGVKDIGIKTHIFEANEILNYSFALLPKAFHLFT